MPQPLRCWMMHWNMVTTGGGRGREGRGAADRQPHAHTHGARTLTRRMAGAPPTLSHALAHSTHTHAVRTHKTRDTHTHGHDVVAGGATTATPGKRGVRIPCVSDRGGRATDNGTDGPGRERREGAPHRGPHHLRHPAPAPRQLHLAAAPPPRCVGWAMVGRHAPPRLSPCDATPPCPTVDYRRHAEKIGARREWTQPDMEDMPGSRLPASNKKMAVSVMCGAAPIRNTSSFRAGSQEVTGRHTGLRVSERAAAGTRRH